MCVAVMVSPECHGETISTEGAMTLLGREWRFGELWGAENQVKAHLADFFGRPGLFA